ncbi:hypothetical protein [Anaerobranca gottschalkii]|uniref:Uncharacterized protein n=1 Tax=Anaerobranca gottschalkii DSM 13577 TaxID=1120990 RepID=A0A1I0A3Y7_9FIRM|nr:hypothetical protein [Anaerobranca gottschalkii]SES88392.1 hypothetical protein SAMN03080614_101637 [Anaerobranca gottschalkii DSM 13577]
MTRTGEKVSDEQVKREKVTAPNQQWQADVKYGYITGTDQFFSSYH